MFMLKCWKWKNICHLVPGVNLHDLFFHTFCYLRFCINSIHSLSLNTTDILLVVVVIVVTNYYHELSLKIKSQCLDHFPWHDCQLCLFCGFMFSAGGNWYFWIWLFVWIKTKTCPVFDFIWMSRQEGLTSNSLDDGHASRWWVSTSEMYLWWDWTTMSYKQPETSSHILTCNLTCSVSYFLSFTSDQQLLVPCVIASKSVIFYCKLLQSKFYSRWIKVIKI